MEKYKKYTHQTAYKEYCALVADKSSVLSFKQFDAAIRLFMRKLSRTIIVDQYEWKIPYGGGYLRIAKDQRGMFFWYWDKANDYTRIPKKLLWSFRAVVDWKDKQIGKRGLIIHYFKCKNDEFTEDYSVPRIDHKHNVRR